MRRLLVIFSSLSLLATLSIARGQETAKAPEVLCHEGFDSPPFNETLLGKSGGKGFDGPWIAAGFNARDHKAYRVVAGSLRPGETKPGEGYMRTEASPLKEIEVPVHAFFGFEGTPDSNAETRTVKYRPIKGLGRRLARPIAADETITIYVAMLFRPESAEGEKFCGGYAGFYLDGTGNSDLFVGAAADDEPQYRLATRGGSGKVKSREHAEIDRTDLLVIKADLRPGTDAFTLYVNPDINGAEPTEGIVKQDLDVGRVSQVVLYSVGACSMDEFRIVDNYAVLAE